MRHTGRTPFWVPTREGITPYIYDGNVDCWLGPDGDNRNSANSDYWRASLGAQMFLIDIYRAANFLIQKHGEDAPLQIFQQV